MDVDWMSRLRNGSSTIGGTGDGRCSYSADWLSLALRSMNVPRGTNDGRLLEYSPKFEYNFGLRRFDPQNRGGNSAKSTWTKKKK